jgi:hypothetical protein
MPWWIGADFDVLEGLDAVRISDEDALRILA